MICQNCGKEITGDQPVCLNCGTPVPDVELKEIYDKGKPGVDSKADWGLKLGLISLLSWLIPVVCYILPFCGLVFSILGLQSKMYKSKAIAGIILNIVGMAITVASVIISIRFMRNAPELLKLFMNTTLPQ